MRPTRNRSIAAAVVVGAAALAGLGFTAASALDTTSPITSGVDDGSSTSGPTSTGDHITVAPTVATSSPTTSSTRRPAGHRAVRDRAVRDRAIRDRAIRHRAIA